MQLPQAVHCYWLTSSAYALAQNGVLSTRFAREALGTERLARVTREMASKRAVVAGEHVPMAPHTLELVKAAAQARAENNNPLAVNLLLRAARSADGGSEAADVALKVDDLARAHPSVLFALGQTYAVLKEWKKSALTYEYSARVEPNPTQRSRALLGAGVARARVGDLNMASEALGEANRLNPTDASIKVALASALKLNGDPEAALDVLRQAAAIQPDIQERYVVPLERELANLREVFGSWPERLVYGLAESREQPLRVERVPEGALVALDAEFNMTLWPAPEHFRVDPDEPVPRVAS